MSHRILLPSRAYRFLYPSINFACLPSKMDERRIVVFRVRDTESDPLDEETLDSNPFIKRGRWLVTGLDLDKFEERSFYVESMIGVTEIENQSAQKNIRHVPNHRRGTRVLSPTEGDCI